MSDAATDAPPAQAGPADLMEIFYAPSAVFSRRRDGKFGLPYVALVVIGLVLFFATKNLVQPVIDAVVSAAVQKGVASGKIPAANADAAIKVSKTAAMIIPFVFFIVGPFLVGLFLWIMGKITKIPAIGSVAIMVATFSMFPRLLGNVVGAILVAVAPEDSITNQAQLSIGPGHFLGANASPILVGLATRFDLFIIWGVVLMAIGLRVAGRASKGAAWTAAIGTWGIITLIALVGALRNS
jgi:hypothetical protein